MARAQGKAPSGRHITSWDDLHGHEREIVEALNADPALALAAAANPILAMEELGFEFDAAARPAIEARFRFRPRTAQRLGKLRGELFRAAGRPFDPTDGADVRAVLKEAGVKTPARAKLDSPGRWTVRGSAAAEGASPRRKRRRAVEAPEDPLAELAGTHEIVEPLLEYRRLEASEARLAAPEVFASIRDGRRELPITGIRGRFKEDGG